LLLSDLEGLPLEPAVLELIDRQLKSGIAINGQVFHPGQGVLQGAVLSGALANLYLTEFDRLCLSSGLNLVRYGDVSIPLPGFSWQKIFSSYPPLKSL
jgi:retron-type reverse transcriptase